MWSAQVLRTGQRHFETLFGQARYICSVMFEFGSAQKSVFLLSDVFYFICITESLTRLVVAQDHARISAVQIQGEENPHKCT